MMFSYYDPWNLGMLVERITISVTAIADLAKTELYIVASNALLGELRDQDESNVEVDWTGFYETHHTDQDRSEIERTDSILMAAEKDEPGMPWKWRKYRNAPWTAKDTTHEEFTQRIQHNGKVLVVTSVLCGGHRWFRDGTVEEVANGKVAWDFEDENEDATEDWIREVRGTLYEGYYEGHLGDEFAGGLEYVVKHLEGIRGLDFPSQIELVRRGYEALADDLGECAWALRGIASRGRTAFEGPAR